MTKLAAQNASSIAESIEARTNLLDERNALLAFAKGECETAENQQYRAEFMRLTRKAHLERLRSRLIGSKGQCAHASDEPRPEYAKTSRQSTEELRAHKQNDPVIEAQQQSEVGETQTTEVNDGDELRSAGDITTTPADTL